MGMSSGGGGQSSESTPVYMPGQRKLAKSMLPQFKEILGGNFQSPIAKALYNITYDKGQKEMIPERERIASSDLPSPTKAKLMGELSGKSIGVAAGAGAKTWEEALDFIKKYIFNQPSQQSTSSSGGGGGGLGDIMEMVKTGTGIAALAGCWIFREAEGDLPSTIEQFRDEKWIGLTMEGYEWMARWLVPLMRKLPVVKEVVRKVITQPLIQYTKWYYGEDEKLEVGSLLSKQIWPSIWKGLGLVRRVGLNLGVKSESFKFVSVG